VRLDEVSRSQYVEVKRERWPRQPKTSGDCSCREALRRMPDKQAKDIEARLLC